ncbi:MAG: hypothetical protein IPL65_11710 [Lewinellaceae bacterium]|nr:hypothetical protein [Lewinellaceae bacterium]
MTLREFFDYLGSHPYWIIGYFLLLPLLALTTGWFSRGEGHRSPWNYLYMILVFAVCIPGIFAVALSVYLFVFERGSIMNTNLFTQVLPFLTMVATLSIIRKNVDFDTIPGFDKISSLIMMIAAIFVLMFFIDRTHIFAFVSMRVEYLLVILIGALLVFRYAMKKIIA